MFYEMLNGSVESDTYRSPAIGVPYFKLDSPDIEANDNRTYKNVGMQTDLTFSIAMDKIVWTPARQCG